MIGITKENIAVAAGVAMASPSNTVTSKVLQQAAETLLADGKIEL